MPRTLALAVALALTLGAWIVAFRPSPRREATIRRAAQPAVAAVVVKTDDAWRQQLTPLQYQGVRQKGTERAFTGRYWDHHEHGIYRCVCCSTALFASDTKFDSGCGWPSYF